jgi:hypothetical protein
MVKVLKTQSARNNKKNQPDTIFIVSLDALNWKLHVKTSQQPFTFTLKSNIVWTTKDYYDRGYHQYIINHLKVLTPDINYLGYYDNQDRLHVHLLADECKGFKACFRSSNANFSRWQ